MSGSFQSGVGFYLTLKINNQSMALMNNHREHDSRLSNIQERSLQC